MKALGILQQLKSSKKGVNYTLQWMEVICDWTEKIRNLFVWEDPTQTSLFFGLALVCFIVVTFLPMRHILFIANIYKFACGTRWQWKRVTNN